MPWRKFGKTLGFKSGRFSVRGWCVPCKLTQVHIGKVANSKMLTAICMFTDGQMAQSLSNWQFTVIGPALCALCGLSSFLLAPKSGTCCFIVAGQLFFQISRTKYPTLYAAKDIKITPSGSVQNMPKENAEVRKTARDYCEQSLGTSGCSVLISANFCVLISDHMISGQRRAGFCQDFHNHCMLIFLQLTLDRNSMRNSHVQVHTLTAPVGKFFSSWLPIAVLWVRIMRSGVMPELRPVPAAGNGEHPYLRRVEHRRGGYAILRVLWDAEKSSSYAGNLAGTTFVHFGFLSPFLFAIFNQLSNVLFFTVWVRDELHCCLFTMKASEGFLTKDQICRHGQKYCDVPMKDNHFDGLDHGHGWESNKTLVCHRFIERDKAGKSWNTGFRGPKDQIRLTQAG